MTNVYWINVEEALSEFKAVYEPYISAFAMAIQELTLKDLQPSQFYISEKKLHDIEVWLNPEVKDFYRFTTDDLHVENYETHPQIKNIPVAI